MSEREKILSSLVQGQRAGEIAQRVLDNDQIRERIEFTNQQNKSRIVVEEASTRLALALHDIVVLFIELLDVALEKLNVVQVLVEHVVG